MKEWVVLRHDKSQLQMGVRTEWAMAGERAQTEVADQEMRGVGHKLHHFADLREFPYLKTNMHNK